ncbi:hypothetical protein [Sphingobium sp. D43FB]|uniref:hypothetical protein n=1 Tax=Sphingobium sp. D43FB TaxID=2017595 RepID=UPI001596A827|nr:hypothetical protein [Sphingobium sp. D43FB]
MTPRQAPSAPVKGILGHGQSGNSGDRALRLDPPSSNADIGFTITLHWGQE